jgi:hypothetical protein
MTAAPAEMPDGPRKQMIGTFEDLLGDAMGVRHDYFGWLRQARSSFVVALGALLANGLIAIFLFWRFSPDTAAGEHAKLLSITIWGGFYFAGGIVLTRYITMRLCLFVRNDVAQFGSEEFAALANKKLKELLAKPMFIGVPIAATIVAMGSAVWALQVELSLFDLAHFPYSPGVWFWFLTSLYFYYTAARAVVTATFPRAFALAFEEAPPPLYVLDAAETPLVQGLSKLNRTVLIYWTVMFFVVVSILSLMLLHGRYALPTYSPFLSILIPVAGFFSLGVGSFVYIDSEATIRGALRRYTLERAKPVQDRINDLLRKPERERAKSVALRRRLGALHDQILAGGRYGSRAGTIISVVSPLALLAIGLIEKLFGQRAG